MTERDRDIMREFTDSIKNYDDDYDGFLKLSRECYDERLDIVENQSELCSVAMTFCK